MEKINHFSHENHPLKLVIVGASVNDIDGDDKKPGLISCHMCVESISSGSFAYGCIECCHFLHKACAQLPPIITDPTLYHFPLRFSTLSLNPSRPWICDVCRLRKKPGHILYMFYGEDKKIQIVACIDCCVALVAPKAEAEAIKEEARVKVEHESHPQHALTLQLRPASFRCDACNSNDEGLFYQCDSGDFWIHKTCASLPPTIDLPYHHPHHHLFLVYSLPEKFFNFLYYCELCNKFILRNVWLYHCANCRYFVHIKCALNAQQPSTPRGSTSEDEYVKGLLHLPMSHSFTDPLRLLYSSREKIIISDLVIKHWSHVHLLILIHDDDDDDNNKMRKLAGDDTILKVCYGCVRPVSLINPYYTCKDGCSFTLHKYCAELPLKLKHQLHPSHPLDLINISQIGRQESYYRCVGCVGCVNAFLYKCETCKFYLDINCAFLPKSIKHKSHKHPLMQVMDPEPMCKACDRWYEGISYACKDCDFQLDIFCATRSPTSLSHRYCKAHEIPLAYPPIIDHAEDFFCEICEKEMHPKFPLYYCQKCKNTFHLECLSQTELYENVIHEGTLSVSYHRHPLTCARRNKSDPKFVCSACNRDINCFLILECHARVCNFNICYGCHLNSKNRIQVKYK